MTATTTTERCAACYCPHDGCQSRESEGLGRCCGRCTHPAPPWPPPPGPADRFQTVPVLLAGETHKRRQLRLVLLRGQTVLADEAGQVWCRRCCELMSVEQALDPDEPHTIAVPAHS